MPKRLRRDVIISGTDKGDLVGVYWANTNGSKILFECSTKVADKIVKLFNKDEQEREIDYK